MGVELIWTASELSSAAWSTAGSERVRAKVRRASIGSHKHRGVLKLGLKKAGISKKPHIIRQKQPAKSPDLTVCDLYVWGVLQDGVNRRRPKTLDQLWQAIQESWKEDLTAAKLECAFRLLGPVMACIYANNGGNAFRLPHSGIRKQMREDGWDI